MISFCLFLLKSVCKELKLTDDYIHFYCCQNYIIVVWHFLRGAFNDARRVGNDTRPLRRWEVHKRDSHENTDLFSFVRFYSNTPPSLQATRFVLSVRQSELISLPTVQTQKFNLHLLKPTKRHRPPSRESSVRQHLYKLEKHWEPEVKINWSRGFSGFCSLHRNQHKQSEQLLQL